MKPLFLMTLLFCVLSSAALADGEEVACNVAPTVHVNVTPRFDIPALDYSQGIDSIQTLAHDSGHSIHESLALGLTRYEPSIELNVPIKGLTFSDGRSCAHVERADVTLGYRDVTILIAREVPEESCGFNEIMAHEQKHINVNREVLDEYIPRIEDRLDDYLRTHSSFQNEKAEKIVAMLREDMGDIIKRMLGDMAEENRRRQQEVDSPEEYRRITYACNGQLAQISLRFLNGHH